MNERTFTPQQAQPKIRHYCAYQERCHAEVRDKLYNYGLNRDEVEEIISTLISENFINEERFAVQYAHGKFRMNRWGKIKIRQHLLQKGISVYNIKKALSGIDPGPYLNTFEKDASKKWNSLKSEKNIFVKKRKLKDFMYQKGFEQHLIYSWLAKK